MSTTPDGPEERTPAAVKDDHGETTAEVTAPEAEQSRLSMRPDPTLAQENPAADGRSHVEWVRVSDLATRGGAWALGRGQDLNRNLMAAVKDAAREQVQALRQKIAEREMDVSVTSPDRTVVRRAGREGVSR